MVVITCPLDRDSAEQSLQPMYDRYPVDFEGTFEFEGRVIHLLTAQRQL